MKYLVKNVESFKIDLWKFGRLQAWFRSTVRIPARARHFYLHQNVRISSGVHAASYSIGTAVLYRHTAAGRDVDHSPPSSADIKNEWNYTYTPFVCYCSVDRDNLTFIITRKMAPGETNTT
jgi:hypothetical protein